MTVHCLARAAALKYELRIKFRRLHSMCFEKLNRQKWDLKKTRHLAGRYFQHIDKGLVYRIMPILKMKDLKRQVLEIRMGSVENFIIPFIIHRSIVALKS